MYSYMDRLLYYFVVADNEIMQLPIIAYYISDITFMITRIHHELRGYHSGKVGTGVCGPDGAHFRPLRFTNGPFLFENWFR